MYFIEAVKVYNQLHYDEQVVFATMSRLYQNNYETTKYDATLVWKENVYDEHPEWEESYIDKCIDSCIQAGLIHLYEEDSNFYYLSYTYEEVEAGEIHFTVAFTLDEDGMLIIKGGENVPADYVMCPGTKIVFKKLMQ